MAYVGRGIDNISNASLLDVITFTDSAGPYNLEQGSAAFTPVSVQALVISVDGVIQSPSSYTISAATITFDSVMASTSTNDFIVHNGIGLITEPSDGSVTAAKIEDEAVTEPKLAATGTPSSSTYLRGDMAWSALTVGELGTINTFFSNWNNIDSSITTTLVTTKNQFLCGPITVADTYTWDVAGTGTLTIL
jgi:hypothetical protein